MKPMPLGALPHLEELHLGVKRIAPGQNNELNFHDHKFTEIAVILHSEGSIHWAEGRSSALHRGDVLLLPLGCCHAYEHTEKLSLINLYYEAAMLPLPYLDGSELRLFSYFLTPEIIGTPPPPEHPIAALAERDLRRVSGLSRQLEQELAAEHPGKNLCCFGLFVTILCRIAAAGGSETTQELNTGALHALNYLNLHFREQISIETLTRLSYLSRSTLFRRFHEIAGCTPSVYLRRKRLELARQLLTRTDRNLNEIALECGFCDSNHLIKLFTAVYGLPPGSFRDREKNISSFCRKASRF